MLSPSHSIDNSILQEMLKMRLLEWLIGPVEKIQSMMSTTREIEVEDTGVVNIKWRNGTIGSVSVTMLTYPKNLEASITILGEKGTVRQFAPPHTGTNYLLNEFVYVVGRKHSVILRFCSLAMMIGIPVGILMVATNFWMSICAALFHLIGVVIARWLFFAQAEHLVGLYYGKR